MDAKQLRDLQALPLKYKIMITQERIREWYEHWDGQVYISFSGGKDSTVLFLAYLRGIETAGFSIHQAIPALFLAYLRGIET